MNLVAASKSLEVVPYRARQFNLSTGKQNDGLCTLRTYPEELADNDQIFLILPA
jgi:hypothetical protein